MHGWHCDCPICSDDDGAGWPFKVQRDSTVDGEVISRVFTVEEWPTALDAMRGLQEAAVEVDAEPGLNAGLHVHVAAPRGERNVARAFLAFVAWEDALYMLAQGRFAYLRDMNRRVLADVCSYLYSMGELLGRGDRLRLGRDKVQALVERARTGDDYAMAYDLWQMHYDADRHSHLSVNTRFATWEFRIWNSTRSAWRMELACRLACAWADTTFIDALLNREGDRTVQALLDTIAADWQGDDRLAALVNRQIDYLPLSADAPARFLVA